MDRAKRYNNTKLALSLTGTILGWTFLLTIVLTGFTKTVEEWALSITSFPYLALLVFAAIVGVIEIILFLPLSSYDSYVLEHKYELSNQTLRSYFWEKIKALFVSVVIGAPLLVTFYFFLVTYEEYWWIPVGIFMFFVSIVLGRLAPTLIFPLFYKFTPVEDPNLTEMVQERCKSVGMRVEGVFRFNMSKTTKKANAAFTGIGKSKRVILADTLLENFTQEEIDAVLAHELGHFRLRHLWKMMAVGTLLTFAGLYIVSALYSHWVGGLGFESITQLAALPLLGLLMALYGFATGPIQNGVSRHYEREADRFSVDLVGTSAPMITALKKLADQNLADREPHPLVEFLFHSHPSVDHRVEKLQTYSLMGTGSLESQS